MHDSRGGQPFDEALMAINQPRQHADFLAQHAMLPLEHNLSGEQLVDDAFAGRQRCRVGRGL
jgi:hypothetical protein